MPVQTPKSFAQYQNDILTALAATGINQLAPGGKARAFGDALADQLATRESNTFTNLAETLVPFATGSSLDLLGEIYGMTRLPQQSAQVLAGDNNFTFYVRQNTFGAINGGQDITVPAGISIFTAATNGPVFTLTDDVTLPAGSNSVSFGAVSTVSGTTGNAPAGLFSRSNFTGYTDYRFGALLVTNLAGIIAGQDAETDDDFRFRIHLRLVSQSGANEDALRLAILAVPGVQDVTFSPYAGGFHVYVYGISADASSSLLASVQTIINQTASYPITGLALAPDLVGISLNTTVTFTGSPTAVDQAAMLTDAVAAATTYIDNLTTGQTLVVNDIAAAILNTAGILDAGQPNQPLDSIFIWRSRADGTRYSRYLVADYTPITGERIVVENQLNAVNITAA